MIESEFILLSVLHILLLITSWSQSGDSVYYYCMTVHLSHCNFSLIVIRHGNLTSSINSWLKL